MAPLSAGRRMALSIGVVDSDVAGNDRRLTMKPPDNETSSGSPGVRHCLAVIFILMIPVTAQAQQISNTIALAALSPIIVVVLAGTVGWLGRELFRGLIDVGLGSSRISIHQQRNRK